jgi:hypothetical protein
LAPCAVGSHTSKAVGQGAHGGRSPLSRKIEMFCDGLVDCSDQEHSNERTNDDDRKLY